MPRSYDGRRAQDASIADAWVETGVAQLAGGDGAVAGPGDAVWCGCASRICTSRHATRSYRLMQVSDGLR